ncbi:MAG: GNAT family N-acetyltransferase [Candidatus Coatesbacteria bacterium]|nr:MAG: GNAT family N-acetyltransferase [Candidatus Coatesbacteria bacterium]
MWWRLTAKEFESSKGEANRRAMRALVRRGDVPGLLAYDGEEAVGWCAVAPRTAYPRLARSRIMRPVDDVAVWSIVCLFVAKPWRDRGVATVLIRAAVEHVRAQGGEAVEGYAVEPRRGRTADLYAYPGPVSAFRAAGFVEVARRSPTRPIMRYLLE